MKHKSKILNCEIIYTNTNVQEIIHKKDGKKEKTRKEKKKKRHESMAPPTLGVTKIKLFIRVIPRLGVAVEY